ncbi:hypothetical protein PFAG_04931 [Plasmodium falciparum Santa Lucia]|uniref:Peptidase S54 rhomboid domain-containing protein n=2 Tax=Plasmodium falciparum TaxID=5833 RepID=W7F8V8_PLAF8|nr:hypothetical protein PFBG_04895 [Plasmodium falciparum 7G8]EUT80290.1 hypothetical protein PFAG_04931 [Plasmodium falciparum Santa Lucia]
MNIIVNFIYIYILFLSHYKKGNCFIHNKINYEKSRSFLTNSTKIILKKNGFKYYHLKHKKIIKPIYSLKSSINNIWNGIKSIKVKKLLGIFKSEELKRHFHNYNLSYASYIFNKCRLDRVLISINVLLYLYLNRIDKNEERKIYFHKGNLIQEQDEQKCEKYKCNYNDVYKNRNYKTFLTSIFIHKNILHLYFNMSSLISIYRLISNVYTNTQIFLIFLLSGFFSNLISYYNHFKKKNEEIYLNDIIDQNYINKKIFNFKNNKIICGSSSAIYALYGMHITHVIFFYFKNHYVINTSFLYNFFYSFISSLLLENVSHFNHIVGFLCGFVFSFLIIAFEKN